MPGQLTATLDQCVKDPEFAASHWAELLSSVASSDEAEREAATEALENCGPLEAAALAPLIALLKLGHQALGSQKLYWICTLVGRFGQDAIAHQANIAAIVSDAQVDMHVRERAAWCLGEMAPVDDATKAVARNAPVPKSERLSRLLQSLLSMVLWTSGWVLMVGCEGDGSLLKQVIDQRDAAAGTADASHGTAPAGAPPSANPVPGQLVSARLPNGQTASIPQRTQQTILIASFNIQAFGESKVGNRPLIERIAAILQLFDVVAIQEVRAQDQTVIPQLLKYVNAQGARYDYILGPRLGRTVSKEQYCYIYDTNRLISSPKASYTVEDGADLLHREPLVARFVTRVPQGYPPFTFSLMNIHTDPDEVKLEMPVMHTVLRGVREYEWATANEDDVLMMGDLNCEPAKFGPLAQVPGIFWIIQNQFTNTRKTKLYDNIIFDRSLTSEFTGRAGVLDFAEMFGISMDEALKLSDHMPIWGEFTIWEQPRGSSPVIANQPSNQPVRQ